MGAILCIYVVQHMGGSRISGACLEITQEGQPNLDFPQMDRRLWTFFRLHPISNVKTGLLREGHRPMLPPLNTPLQDLLSLERKLMEGAISLPLFFYHLSQKRDEGKYSPLLQMATITILSI